MTEVLKIIAMLCQVHGANTHDVNFLQAQCHAHYAECVLTKERKISVCMKERLK